MHSLNISAFVLATTVAGRTFINVPVGLDKGTVNDVLSSHGIPGFDPNGRPNADGLYTTNNNNNNNNINNVDSHRHMLENHIEQDQPMMLRPAPPPVEPFAIAPFIYDEPAPLRPASFPLPPSAAAPAAHSDSPPPGHPVAVPLAPARELRPGLLVEPPVVARDPSVQSPQALRPNPPIMPPTLPQALPPPQPPVHPAVAIPPPAKAAEVLPLVSNAPATTTAAAETAIKPALTTIIHDNGVLVSTMLVMVTAPKPPMSPLAQPTSAAMGKAGAAEAAPSENVAEEDESEDESTSSAAQAAAAPPIIASPAAASPPLPQVAAPVVSSAAIAAAATAPATTTTSELVPRSSGSLAAAAPSSSVASSSSSSSESTKRTGPVRLKPLMFAKANVSAFKPEDIDQFTFPSAELSVNMAGLGGGKDNGGSISSAHAVVAAAGFEGSMPSGEHGAKPTANNSVNRVEGAAAAKPTIAAAAADTVAAARAAKPSRQRHSQAGEPSASAEATAPRGDRDSAAAASALQQQASLGAAVLLAAVIHVAAAAMF
ncbi:hypothetical protein GGF44_002603 [Coemansia sp. RSA 1694]|nr:hypothetical protein GGF44_002603 [Coemansia sp. RSA 1694]